MLKTDNILRGMPGKVETGMGWEGEPIYFTGCKLVLEKERWNAQ